jgi:hypothetical protein
VPERAPLRDLCRGLVLGFGAAPPIFFPWLAAVQAHHEQFLCGLAAALEQESERLDAESTPPLGIER